MVTSVTQIMNSALNKLGAERILSEDDGNNRARLLKAQYPLTRDQMLVSHPWNFAISYVELAAVSPTPADVYDYDYVFQLPQDCLRVIAADLDPIDDWEEIEGRRIAANISELTVKYIKRVTDFTKYSENFLKALIDQLAADCAFALVQNAQLADGMQSIADRSLRTARSFDAQVGSVKVVESDEWLRARRY